MCACREVFVLDHAMICNRSGFVIQRHNEPRDLEGEICNNVEGEPVPQDIGREQLNSVQELIQFDKSMRL